MWWFLTPKRSTVRLPTKIPRFSREVFATCFATESKFCQKALPRKKGTMIALRTCPPFRALCCSSQLLTSKCGFLIREEDRSSTLRDRNLPLSSLQVCRLSKLPAVNPLTVTVMVQIAQIDLTKDATQSRRNHRR